MLERRFSSPPHVRQNALTEVPAQEVIRNAIRVGRISTHRVKRSTVYPHIIRNKRSDFIVVLLDKLAKHPLYPDIVGKITYIGVH